MLPKFTNQAFRPEMVSLHLNVSSATTKFIDIIYRRNLHLWQSLPLGVWTREVSAAATGWWRNRPGPHCLPNCAGPARKGRGSRYTDGLIQDYHISNALSPEIPHFCTNPLWKPHTFWLSLQDIYLQYTQSYMNSPSRAPVGRWILCYTSRSCR